LFNFLQNNHYMSNSLVILLSDHGEALYYSGSRLTNYNNYQGSLPSRLAEYFKQKTATQLDKSAGHGSDILSPKQYHNVLAFALYKNGLLTTQARQIKTRVALIDIAPTVLAYLNIPSPLKEDGISLLPAIINPKYILPERYFYLESGMCPNQSFSRKKTLELGKLFYWVNPDNDELEIKPNALKAINDHKLYGIIQGDWIFALYPDDKSYIPIIQNLSTGQWSDDFYSRFSKSTPSHKLYAKIRQYYGKQLVFSIDETIPNSKAVIHKKN
ncbi:MAG: sulfatase, partial [bacterium]|nr:sulfatase [bacterium]